MEPTPRHPVMLAPGASAASSTPLRCPAERDRLPRLDEHLLPEDSPYEIIDGRRVLCMANPEHAGPQLDIGSVLRFHLAPGYRAMVELTTRADTLPPPPDLDPNAAVFPETVQELRSDVSILKEGTDPRTGDRYVEDLSFEVVNEQSLSDLRKKARRLSERGVRRVFGLVVKRRRLLEWSRDKEDFELVREDAFLEDRCLRLPVRVKALLDVAEVDNAVAQALIARDNQVINELRREERREGHQEGHREGQQQALLTLLAARGFALPDQVRARILACSDQADLTRWIFRAATATALHDIFDPQTTLGIIRLQ